MRNGWQILNSTKINVYDALRLILLVNENKPNGRTVLQKLTYFCCKYIPEIEDVDFKPHHYGPYSAKLSMVLEEMVSCGFIDESVKSGPPYDRYHYRLSDNGKELASRASNKSSNKYDRISHVVNVCSEKTNLTARNLSHAAKVHYISKELNDNTPGKIVSMAHEHGWEIVENDVKIGNDLIISLDDGS